MSDKTMLVIPGRRLSVPKPVKRLVQVLMAVTLTAMTLLVLLGGSTLLVGKTKSPMQAFDQWLSFVRQPEIITVMVLTALVTILFVYWQRDQERRPEAKGR
ncbi:MAG: hypothetical protein NW205_01435 [Hyphomicrobiaceae bacterium]|nr:hypothetical protein [Hyphomicrobiaceae bacterium]